MVNPTEDKKVPRFSGEWVEKYLSDLVTVNMGQSPDSRYYNNKVGLPLIQGKADIKNRKTVIHNYTSQYPKIAIVNDIILTVRAPVGFVALATFDCCIGRGVCALKHANDFIYHYLIYKESSWKNISKGSTFDSINADDIQKVILFIPISVEEQAAIANILTHIDELLASLQKLIEKKRAVKQGAMQELLTGKKRLPGFKGEWVNIKLGSVSHIKTGDKNNDQKSEDGAYPFFVRSQNIERINTYSYDGEAILIPGEGNIGNIIHYINNKFDWHQRVYKISDFPENICGKYLYYQLKENFGKHALMNTVKATVDSLRLPTFEKFIFLLPPTLSEQTAIADILTNMDDEIEQLEQKLAKYENIKTGMMQVLLTGKIRLTKS